MYLTIKPHSISPCLMQVSAWLSFEMLIATSSAITCWNPCRSMLITSISFAMPLIPSRIVFLTRSFWVGVSHILRSISLLRFLNPHPWHTSSSSWSPKLNFWSVLTAALTSSPPGRRPGITQAMTAACHAVDSGYPPCVAFFNTPTSISALVLPVGSSPAVLQAMLQDAPAGLLQLSTL